MMDGSTDAEPIVIAEAEVLEVNLPLREPFVTGFGSTSTRRTVLVHLIDDMGHAGWGEAAALDHPFYLPDTTTGSFALIVEYALPLALAAQPRTPFDVAHALSPIKGNTFARAAVEAAYWTLMGERLGASLRRLVGGERWRIPVGESIGIKPTIEQTLEEVAIRLDEGYRRIKLKIHPGWDVDVVRAVRDTFGDILLQVDANASYTLDDATVLRQLDSFGLVCIEQPLAFDDFLGHVELQRQLGTPICLDESLRSVDDVRRALSIDACRNVNLKPGRVGGIAAALAIHDLCVEREIPLWCGGMLESGIGRAPNIALCTLPGFTQPADMSPAPVLFEGDLISPSYQVEGDGFVAVSEAPGLGYAVDLERIQRWTLRRTEVAVPITA